MDQPLQVLVIDDDEDDFALARDVLVDAFGPTVHVEWAATYEAGVKALGAKSRDVCLLDYRLGAKTGLDLLHEIRGRVPETPIILLTGQGQREIDMQAMQAGAADFLTKDDLRAESLERAVRHALERHRDRQALRQLNEILETRVERRTRELAEANEALQLADRRKDEFLAILAHELRNPLAPIRNSLELLTHSSNDAHVCDQARATMRRQLDQLVRLTDDLLEVSRISQGKIALRMEPTNLASVVAQAVEAARPGIAARGQTLTTRLPPDEIRLLADPGRLAQVIGNLLNNASKFSPPGGRIEVRGEAAGAEAVVTVRDEGIGIESEQLDRIFEMFQQVDAALERSEAGLGIGLTLVRQLTLMHGGSIEARSEGLGRGSEFIIRLPLDEAPRAESAPAAGVKGAAQTAIPGRRILVVDDNRDSATSMAMLLKLSGHQSTTAFTGMEAIEKAASTDPHVILLDIGLPDLNGYEVARRLREKPGGDKVALVALTGWGQDADRRRAEEAGFDHHLLKPVEYPTLLELLGRLL